MSNNTADFNFFNDFMGSHIHTIYTIGMIIFALYQFSKCRDKNPKLAFSILSLSLFITLIVFLLGSKNNLTEYASPPYNIILYVAILIAIFSMPVTLYFDFKKSDDESEESDDEPEKKHTESTSNSSSPEIINNQELIDSKKRKILIEIDSLKSRLSEHEGKKNILESDLWLNSFKTKTGFLAITENEYGRNKARQTAIGNEETEIRSLRAKINGLKENAAKLSTSVVC